MIFIYISYIHTKYQAYRKIKNLEKNIENSEKRF